MGERSESTYLSETLARIDKANEERYNYINRITNALDRFSPPAPITAEEGKAQVMPNESLIEKFGNALNFMEDQNRVFNVLTERLEKIM